ncbi:MAG: hypothetical protein NZ580_03030 [Bacteroidia bacterium]|nr:hypothetical protein [Bacteroidia bacterium]MDW8235306.1 hypothetical protein [Bacteroidia bacterium]
MRLPIIAAIVFAELISLAFLFSYHAEWEGGRLRSFLLMDEAMISMNYARSLAEGCGLVWYCGAEKVEGITNLGWTLYMTLWHGLGIPSAYAALPILLTGLLTLGVHIWASAKAAFLLQGSRAATFTAWGMALLPLTWVWHGAGIEAGSLATLLTLLFLELILETPSMLRIALWTGLGVFIRMDFALWIGAFLLSSLLIRRTLQIPKVMGFTALSVIAACTAFRWIYYDAWLPNTYFLRVSEVPTLCRIVNGAMASAFFVIYNLPLIVLGLWGLGKAVGYRIHIIAWIAVTFIYNIYAGGDLEEVSFSSSRFLFLGITPLFILASEVGSQMNSFAQVGLLLLIAHGVPLYPATIGARWRALLGPVRQFLWNGYWDEQARPFFFGVKPTRLEGIVPKGSVVAVGFAGTHPYFNRDYRWIDFFGKNDTQIAHTGHVLYCGAMPYMIYFPGHTRWGWEKLLKEADAILDVLGMINNKRICYEGRDWNLPRCGGWRIFDSLRQRCATKTAYVPNRELFPFPNTAIANQVCSLFTPSPVPGLWVRKVKAVREGR